jgi:hypothetical protein
MNGAPVRRGTQDPGGRWFRTPARSKLMGKGLILWMVGVPIPIIILLFVFHVIH